MTVPKITDCYFKVSPKKNGKRTFWCFHDDKSEHWTTKVIGYSGTSLEASYQDYRKQCNAALKGK